MAPPKPLVERNLRHFKCDINLSTFAVLFTEMVRHAEKTSATMDAFNARLSRYGERVGERLVDYMLVKERRYAHRIVNVVKMLMHVRSDVWRYLFNKEMDSLTRDTVRPNVFYLTEDEPLIHRFISVPKDKRGLLCSSFCAGLLQGYLTAAAHPCQCSVVIQDGKTFYMVEFQPEVIAREQNADK